MLPTEARAALLDQIESLSPSAALLEANGVDWETAATLAAAIKSGKPNLVALKEHGIPLETAVEICSAIAKRHARRNAALVALTPTPVKPVAPKAATPKVSAPELDGQTAASMLHTLCVEMETPHRACLTTLMRDGFSEPTAREIVKVINAARASQRGVR